MEPASDSMIKYAQIILKDFLKDFCNGLDDLDIPENIPCNEYFLNRSLIRMYIILQSNLFLKKQIQLHFVQDFILNF
jgi:hypothetical protein